MNKIINFSRKFFVLLILFFLIFSLTKNIFDYQHNIAFFQNLKKEYINEQEKNKKLKKEIIKTQDFYFLEKSIREQLSLIRPNEVVLILPKNQEKKNNSNIIKEKPIYGQWLELFIDYEYNK